MSPRCRMIYLRRQTVIDAALQEITRIQPIGGKDLGQADYPVLHDYVSLAGSEDTHRQRERKRTPPE